MPQNPLPGQISFNNPFQQARRLEDPILLLNPIAWTPVTLWVRGELAVTGGWYELWRDDSFLFFEGLGDLLITGPRRTGMMEACILVVGKEG
jgi:hypothetical protein